MRVADEGAEIGQRLEVAVGVVGGVGVEEAGVVAVAADALAVGELGAEQILDVASSRAALTMRVPARLRPQPKTESSPNVVALRAEVAEHGAELHVAEVVRLAAHVEGEVGRVVDAVHRLAVEVGHLGVGLGEAAVERPVVGQSSW